jgi:hypothetical protein
MRGFESEVQAEQAQVETFTNLALDQGKPDASHHLPWLLFVLNHYLYDMLDYVLRYRNCVGTVVVSWLSF